MKKSRYIFIILTVVYTGLAFFYMFDLVDISSNLLFALSVSALLVSASDVVYKLSWYYFTNNIYNADLKIIIDYLDSVVDKGTTNTPHFNVRNLTVSFREELKKDYVYCNPYDYAKRAWMKAFTHISQWLFIIGIAAFIIIPFLEYKIIDTKIASIITILAFSAMTSCLFIDELISEKQRSIDLLLGDKFMIIQSDFNDFRSYFDARMYYVNDLHANQEKTDKTKFN